MICHLLSPWFLEGSSPILVIKCDYDWSSTKFSNLMTQNSNWITFQIVTSAFCFNQKTLTPVFLIIFVNIFSVLHDFWLFSYPDSVHAEQKCVFLSNLSEGLGIWSIFPFYRITTCITTCWQFIIYWLITSNNSEKAELESGR